MEKQGLIRFYISKLALVFVLLARLIVESAIVGLGWIEIRLWESRVKLASRTLCGSACDDTAAQDSPCATNEGSLDAKAGYTVDDFISYLVALDADHVKDIREHVENGYYGEHARQTCPDRRVYAVLEPTKQENLVRIKNTMAAMPDDLRRGIIAGIMELLNKNK